VEPVGGRRPGRYFQVLAKVGPELPEDDVAGLERPAALHVEASVVHGGAPRDDRADAAAASHDRHRQGEKPSGRAHQPGPGAEAHGVVVEDTADLLLERRALERAEVGVREGVVLGGRADCVDRIEVRRVFAHIPRTGNIVTGIRRSRRKSMTAGSRTSPSSIVKNTTGLGVGTREMIGATEPPWIGTGVGAGSGVVVVVVVVDVDVDVVVEPLDVRCCCDRATCAARPPYVNDPANP